MKVLCVGMMVCDTLLAPVPFDILKRDSVAIRPPAVSCGGDALNVALGLAKLGQRVSVMGRIADDLNGRFILEQCRSCGVDTGYVAADEECPTASSFALIDQEGERHFLSEKSIFQRLEGSDIPDQAIEEADIIYFGSAMAMGKMDDGGIRNLFRRAHRRGKLTVMDAAVNWEKPDRDWMELLGPAFAETDIFFPSLEEAVKLTGEGEPEKIAERFRKFSMKLFGIKLGDKGSFATDFSSVRRIGCPRDMPVVDTTGAGDSFMAGLICGLSQGWDGFESAAFASCVASKNVGAYGGTGGVPSFKEALEFYESRKIEL